MKFQIGQKVRATRQILQLPDDYSPGYVCAEPGDVLIVRSVNPWGAVFVSHEHRSDDSFVIHEGEVVATEAIKDGRIGL